MLILQGCNFSDSTENLGDGFFYRNEGGDIKDILCEKPKGGQIPSTVVDFAYNNEFIIAKQKPKLPQDILYDKNYNYKLGADFTYYWLIVKDKHIVLGPFDEREFMEERKKYKIPEKLEFK